jgi:DNA-binding response OmpR family regulator
MRILLIEDDADTARAIKEILRQNNYVVDTTGSGEEALEIIKIYLDMYDLVILDLMLPDMDGLDLCRAIRALGDGRILVVSDEGDLFEARLRLDAAGRLAGLDRTRITPLAGPSGGPLGGKLEADAETNLANS